MLSANFKLAGFYSWFSPFFTAFYLVEFPRFLPEEQRLPVPHYLPDRVCYDQKLCDANCCEGGVYEFQDEPDGSHFWNDDCPRGGGGAGACAHARARGGDVNGDQMVWVLSPPAFHPHF